MWQNTLGTELRDRIEKLEWRAECNLAENSRRDGVVFKLQNEVEKLRHDIDELKKNQNLRKILDAFFQKYRIALEVQSAQHRLHSTSWYKDVKKLKDIIIFIHMIFEQLK
ncbi:13950_t:CDS:2, partial [Rhizophagus irregularis]